MFDIAVPREDIDACARELEELASSFWSENEAGIFSFNVLAGKSVDVRAVFSIQEKPQDALLDTFLSDMGKLGIKEFQKYARGSDTKRVFACVSDTGHQYAVRFGAIAKNDTRPICPLVVQPYRIWQDDTHKIEFLPLLPLPYLKNSDDAFGLDISLQQGLLPEFERHATLKKIIITMLSDTSFKPYVRDMILKDIALLPDGTPVNVDPGQIRFQKNSDVSLSQSMDLLLSRANELGLPDVFRWIQNDRTWKQDKFFPNPFGFVDCIECSPS